MMDKRLISSVEESKRYIAGNVAAQWVCLIANITMIAALARLFGTLFQKKANTDAIAVTALIMAAAAILRFFMLRLSTKMSFLSAREVKKKLRSMIYQKLLALGVSYREQAATSEVVQVAVEGVDQLETYFGAYLPQFFYSMLTPLTLFVVLLFVDVPVAIVLFACVPLIPAAIAAVQTFAKKLLSKYWGQYTSLGDTFLENLQGLTALKIYESDGWKQEQMDRESEQFRKITMRVLTMQLNSITIMDLVAYGGAAAGMAVAVTQLAAGKVSLSGCLFIVLIAADFFIPMRQLGSFFHIAMNGMAASDKIFRLLELPEAKTEGTPERFCAGDLCLEHVSFSYDKERIVLQDVSLQGKKNQLTALVGESGCGKSTIASLVMGQHRVSDGRITIGGVPVSQIPEKERMTHMMYIGHDSYLFKGTVRDNLLMGKPDASDEELWEALRKVRLDVFLQEEKGLSSELTEKASNLSGGQRQRLALARALLCDSDVYIFDEATSNVDAESEEAIIAQIYELSETKTVLMISHRLANVTKAGRIYVLGQGRIVQSGTHESLLAEGSVYQKLWNAQQELEQYGKGGAQA